MFSVKDIPEWYRRLNPQAVEQVVTEAEESTFTEREKLAAQRAAIQSDLDTQVAESIKAEKKALAAYRAAESKMREANAECTRLAQDRNNLAHRLGRRISDIERELRETADNATLDAFLAELESRRVGLQMVTRTQDRDTFGGMVTETVATNCGSIQRFCDALVIARKQAEALRLYPGRNLQAKLDEIRDSLPAVTMERIKPHRAAVAPASVS